MQEKPIPAPKSWGTKKAKAGGETVVFQVTAIDPIKEHLTYQRFVRYLDSGAPLLGRKSTLDFKTWQTGRYQPCDPPAAPVPEMLGRAAAETRLRAIDPPFSYGEIVDILDNPRETIAGASPEKDIPPQARETARAVLAICAAYVRWLDAQAAPPVAVFVPPEPVSDVVITSQAEMADLKAEIAACRADVAGLRSEVRALTEAIKTAVPQMRLFPVAA